MSRTIKKVYVIHHSHTDVGYTDLQENTLEEQSLFIRQAMDITENEETCGFRWNCETLHCVERFLEDATAKDRERFLALAKAGKIGLSANYLNFTDLADAEVLCDRLSAWQSFLKSRDITMNAAMCADINGVSMGFRNALIENGIEFFYTNINTNNGKSGTCPLGGRQTPFFWESKSGGRLLVWLGEHYHIGNELWLHAPEHTDRFSTELDAYLARQEQAGYPYDFIIISVSGVFSDNAPPNKGIYEQIELYNKKYPDSARVEMVTLTELYENIKDCVCDAPVYCGDFTDWWANGVGSTPFAVKLYRDAQRKYSACKRLDSTVKERYPLLARAAEDNLLLYAEHTWGHAMSVKEPYYDLAASLHARKCSYASKAQEAAATIMKKLQLENGEIIRYYALDGRIKALNANEVSEKQLIQVVVRNQELYKAEVTDGQGNRIKSQISPHSYGSIISFVDSIEPFGEKIYSFKRVDNNESFKSGFDGANGKFENKFFSLSYAVGKGITSFVDRRNGRELLKSGEAPFFTPIYQVTEVLHPESANTASCERRALGLNIAGENAKTFEGELNKVTLTESGEVFTTLRLSYTLPGTQCADVLVRFFEDIPRVDFSLCLAKDLSTDIENIFMPLGLNFEDSELSLLKGCEAFRPGTDQLPGTCMEYYITDDGLAYTAKDSGAIIASYDVPLIYMGETCYHQIRLCSGDKKDNARPVFSWVMNNKWPTNFNLNLSGFGSFNYSLYLTDEPDGERTLKLLHELAIPPTAIVIQ